MVMSVSCLVCGDRCAAVPLALLHSGTFCENAWVLVERDFSFHRRAPVAVGPKIGAARAGELTAHCKVRRVEQRANRAESEASYALVRVRRAKGFE
ncbi:hypothetical protein D3C85_1577660 [compost metagenome]